MPSLYVETPHTRWEWREACGVGAQIEPPVKGRNRRYQEALGLRDAAIKPAHIVLALPPMTMLDNRRIVRHEPALEA